MRIATLAMLAAAGALFMLRTLRGPSLSARVVGIDGMIIAGLGIIAVDAMYRDEGIFIPIVVVITLVGFVSTAAAARFIERRELDTDDEPDGGTDAVGAADDPAGEVTP